MHQQQKQQQCPSPYWSTPLTPEDRRINGSVLDNGHSYTSGRHASLMTSGSRGAIQEATQLREGLLTGTLTGQKVNYLDSGYSEEDPNEQVTSCLMKTSSGSIYIPPNMPKNPTMDSRQEYRFGHSSSSPSHSPTKESLKNSERSTLQYTTSDTPFLPMRNNLQGTTSSIKPPRHSHSRHFAEKNFARKCSWRCIAIFFVVLAVILSAALAYITASSFLPVSYESAKACAVLVEDTAKEANNNKNNKKASASASIAASNVIPSSSSENAADQNQPRNLPPDGTTFNQISLGPKQRLSHTLPAYGYWNVQFYQMEAAYVHFDLWLPRGASLGFYARRNALPTHTNYDMMEVIKGASTEARTTRSVQRTVEKRLSLFLREGHWFVSLYNDFGDAQTVDMVAALALEMTEGCPNGCNGHGECVLGRCQCESGYGGEDCSQGACPLLCGGHGDYKNGECECHPGWKGKECSLRHDECEVADCSGRGRCEEGQCQCMKGFTGDFCQKVDCPDPTCSEHGFCVDGSCICKKGWKGLDCGILDEEARQCLPDCSGHGVFDLEAQKCECFDGWVGDDCSSKLCDLDCGSHGRCEDTACVCETGWRGHRCEEQDCDPRCSLHGQCKNGTCLCVAGWNGLHCTLEGCPRGCSNHGSCKADFRGEWSCHCHQGWEGPDCSVRLETRCNDGYDDDQDGLIDCQDPECCEESVCKGSQLCATVARPIDILLQRQPPASTASFFQKMRFIIEEGSLQRYAKNTAFNESRAAVLRGRVVTTSGRGLTGVRVTHADIHTEGYTMTQEDGWFDFMVNGGGAVTLTFGKSPFPAQIRSLFVPWNEVMVIDPVVMSMNHFEPEFNNATSVTCHSHQYDIMKPIMVASWRLGAQSASRGMTSGIVAESRVLQEVLPIPNSNVKLVYHSGRARGYLSTIELRLTPEIIPPTLRTISLRITIEGVLFEKTFEADPDLKYTYSWNRLNIYRQRVYGSTTAVVKVGYFYEDCVEPIWDVQTTKITGQDLTVSDVGGWDLDVHHRYNPQEGILYKGDGSNVYLSERPRLIFNLMGNGMQRPLECSSNTCHGQALDQKLLSPASVVSGADGSIFVGDFDLIRRIMPNGLVVTLLKLPSSGVAHRYHMALNPHDDTLYVSNPEKHQVIKIINMLDPQDVENNFEPVIGSGNRCLPGDPDQCGDGGHAIQAKLAYPKGIAISSDNQIYIADGTTIRMVDEDGLIQTLIGSQGQSSRSWKPIGCHGTSRLEDVSLRWPSDLAISPLDNSLHFIDDSYVLKITKDNQVEIVAGRPLHCHSSLDRDLASFAAKTSLVSPQALSFFGNGDIYLAESDGQRVNRINRITTDGRLELFAGRESKCNCQDPECPCFDETVLLASDTVFGSISSLAVSPDGSIIVSDQANRRIRTIKSSIPELIQRTQEYEVYSPVTQEVYIFNRFGLHIETRNIPSGTNLFRFSYSVSTSNGKLIAITDAQGNKLKIMRDYAGQASAIENPLRQKFNLKLDRKRMLTEFTMNNYTTSYGYTRSSELIQSKITSDKSNYVYDYDNNGRLTNVVLPTGDLLALAHDLDLRGSLVNISLNGQGNILSIRIRPGMIFDLLSGVEIKTNSDKSFVKTTEFGHQSTLKTRPYELLKTNDKSVGLAECFPIPVSERTDIGRDTVAALEWQYFRNKHRSGKRLRINGETMMTIELNDMTNSQILMLESTQAILNISDSRISMLPSGLFSSVIFERNGFGLPKSWKWGDQQKEFEYDMNNRLKAILEGKTSRMEFRYQDQSSGTPEKVTIPSGGSFVFSQNEIGELEYVMTPRGHTHALNSQKSLKIHKSIYKPPWSRQPYEMHFDFRGHLLGYVLPEGSGKVVFNYDSDQGFRLNKVIGDSRSIDYSYVQNANLIKTIKVSETDSNFAYSSDLIYHYGLLKEVTVNYKSNKDLVLNNLNIKYTYDGSARLGGITTQIGRHEPEVIMYKYNARNGRLEGVKDLRIRYESLRKIVIQDLTKSFSLTRDLDSYGRMQEMVIRINGYEQYRLKLDYLQDLNMIKTKSISLARGSPISQNFEYTSDLALKSVKTEVDQDWNYNFDANGNIINVQRGEKKTKYILDGGDRIAMVNSQEYVTYDERGFVIKRGETHYKYNAFGQMTSAFESGKFALSFFYDDLGRIIAKRDHRKNVVQFLYGNPFNNRSVTQVHYPKASRTYHLIYDEDSGHLIAMDTPDSRYYIGTDHVGSPMAVFDSKGRLVKEMTRSPFGQIIRDTNPQMDLSIDFAGGLIDQYTHLVHIGDRVYDPVLGQWMTPLWTKVANPGNMKSPFDVFCYRFHNNDPINLKRQSNFMTGMKDWLGLFGLQMNKFTGSHYTSGSHHLPLETPKLNYPQFSINVGLVNQQKESEDSLKRPNLLTGTGSNGSPSLTPEKLDPVLNSRLATRSSSFGQGLLLSDIKGRAVVNIVQDGSQGDVVQSVLSSILNASSILEASHGGREDYYFLKTSGFTSDLNELQRLSGTYNITTESGIRNNVNSKVLCAQNRASTICILYGIEKRMANRWALKKAYREAVTSAWRKEVNAVKNGLDGYNHAWAMNERVELTSIGEVRGYQGLEVNSVHKYPQLIGQSSNIRFVPEAEARRKRKNWQ